LSNEISPETTNLLHRRFEIPNGVHVGDDRNIIHNRDGVFYPQGKVSRPIAKFIGCCLSIEDDDSVFDAHSEVSISRCRLKNLLNSGGDLLVSDRANLNRFIGGIEIFPNGFGIILGLAEKRPARSH
jgi:hypothetical protein